ncbi:MAG: preprotein translocase subunit YajC [Proteobacteria bacterium]|nr:preprotein translocase subunit YajC [Pseudomonadota bacterium]
MGGASQIVLLIVIFGIMYLLIILPEQRNRKKHQELLNNLKKGDKVLMQSGIRGVVTKIKDNVVAIKIAEKVEIEVEKPYIIGLYKQENRAKEIKSNN